MRDEAFSIHWCDHHEVVRGLRSTSTCSGCVAGKCAAALACLQPDPDPAPTRRPSLSRRARNCLLLAAIGGGGVLVCGVAELFHRFS